MTKMEIGNNYPEIFANVSGLEEEGKTVVILAIDKVP